MPTVSVIIPCYNLGEYLSKSIGSVISQTFGDWECIVINDGSTDNTRDIAESFVSADKRVRYLEQKNKGLSATRNRGLDEARGDYVQFLDADDWIESAKFERQLGQMQTCEGPGLSYCDYERRCDDAVKVGWTAFRVSPDLDLDKPLIDLAMRWENSLSIPSHCFLFDAQLFRGVLRFDENLKNHEDWDCWMQILATKPRVFYLPEMRATYRFRPDSLALDLHAMRKGFLAAIRKQQRLFAQNHEMQAVLAGKLRDVESQYRDFGFPRSAILQFKRGAETAARAALPDRLKRSLKKTIGQDF